MTASPVGIGVATAVKLESLVAALVIDGAMKDATISGCSMKFVTEKLSPIAPLPVDDGVDLFVH